MLAIGLLVGAGQAFGLLGPASGMVFAGLNLLCLAAIVAGFRVHRPRSSWPWVLLSLAVVLFTIGGAARNLTGGFADLSESRAIGPDVVTLSGYALICAAAIGMIRARYGDRPDGFDALLDAAVASLSALCLGWVFFIGPALGAEGAPPAVRAVMVAYPLMSSFLVALLLRLGFSAGGGTGYALRLLIAAGAAILAGDVVFMLAELQVIPVDWGLLVVPYTVGQAATASAALDPSMRDLTVALGSSPGPARFRVAVVAAALALPGAVAMTLPAMDRVDRLAVSAIIALLTAIAVWRVVRAMRAQIDAQARLAHQATHDPLTGLPNRAYLAQHLPPLIADSHARGRCTALLFLDVDRFKFVNDSLGHTSGDELLLTIGRRLTNAVRSDDVVARIGGDEFVIVLTAVAGLDDAVQVAERVRLSFQVPVTLGGSQLVISTSIGVALSRHAGESVDDLVRDADSAMYQAKEAGRNAVAVFDQSMLERAARRLELEAELRRAVERDQLAVHYQPLVTLPEGHVTGFEALLRWTHPRLGPITPAEFIPLAEDTGLIDELGQWILDQACQQLARWRASLPGGRHLQISVNVSARQLRDEHFPSIVAACLARAGLRGGALWLELTESLLLDDPASIDPTLHRLRALGVRLAVDDFGTGYSSLAYLKRFPVDRVKIDRAFVRGLDEDGSSDESLIAAIVAMARALRLSTVAEGVETGQQARWLHELQVDAAQGYHFAPPLPPSGVPQAVATLGVAKGPALRIVPHVA